MYSFWNKNFIKMFKFYSEKIISFLVLFAFIYTIYSFIFGSPIYFDSIEDFQEFFVKNSNNSPETSANNNSNNNGEDDPLKIHPPLITFYDKVRRKLHWEIYGHNNYATVKEFNKSWKSTDSLRSKLKSEIKKLSKNPRDYLKKDYYKTREVIIKRNTAIEELERKNYYVEGKGWLTREGLRVLNAKGYTVKDSKIIKIFK